MPPGEAFPISHRFTVDHVTHKMCAKSSCENPSARRIFWMRLGVMLVKVRLVRGKFGMGKGVPEDRLSPCLELR